MDLLFLLIGLTVLAVPVLLIVALVQIAHLKTRVFALEKTLSRLGDGNRVTAASSLPPIPETSVAPPPARTETSEPAELPPLPAKPDTAQPADLPPPPADPSRPWAAPLPEPAHRPKAVVFRRDRAAQLAAWLRENWFYAVSGVSLALAGLFFVQYGIETGLLSPTARVAAALVFGAALIAAGEVIRARYGEGEASTTAYLPAIFAGAGLVSIFGGIAAARILYDLIAPGPALAGLALTGAGALLLGWMHGPLLAALGIAGAMGAPYVTGGDTDTPEWLLLYFAVIAAAGLGIDTLRRWAWVSVLSVAAAFAAAWPLYLGTPTLTMAAAMASYAAALALMAVLIPARGLAPDQDGPPVLPALLTGGKPSWPAFPARLSLGALIAATLTIAATADASPPQSWFAVGLWTGLAVLYTLWSRHAPALQDHPLAPAATLLIFIGWSQMHRTLHAAMAARIDLQTDLTDKTPVYEPTLLLAAATLVSAAAAWRSLRGGAFRLPWALLAAGFAPAAGLALEIVWRPAGLIGAWPWALHALALAAGMTLMAERFGHQDAQDRNRLSLPVLAALTCLAFALTLILTATALTLALATLIVAAAALDRRFDLPLMPLAIAGGVVALGYRLVIAPGLDGAMEMGWPDFLASYGGSLVALLTALNLQQPRSRPLARVMLESAAFATTGIAASLTLQRLVADLAPQHSGDSHWTFGLHATIWTLLALAQIERGQLGGWLRHVRSLLAAGFGLIALLFLALALTAGNPLLAHGETILGWPLLNTLIPAYLLPALALGAGAARLTHLHRTARLALAIPALALAIFWLFTAIRHAWHMPGPIRLSEGFTDPELYSYTVALLVTGAALFYQALAKRSDALRRAGVLVIALAVAKVFLIDISGLQGLTRVFSFLLLGLSLAGLAWLNRWVQSRAKP